ncbi:MAG: WYL domain-containing protein, partial [Bacteroidales bacterium]|nr:WYL domain-containing protein [Bacteroidales bacterium]
MPITKDAFLRYRILDKCFRNTAVQYQIGDLVKKCNEELDKSVSRRTIYYDIEYMQSLDGWEAPIEIVKDGNRRYYRYSDPKFSIDKMQLSEAQLKQLQSSLDLVKTIAGLPQFESLDDTYSKIGLITYNTKAEPCVSLDHNEYVEGQKHIPTLFNAIQYQTVVKIKYKPFDKEAAEYKFHPQFLKQYNNRWYILGISDDSPDQIWNFALDRIKTIKPTKLQYKKIDVDWKTYFEDIIGVTNYADKPVE